MIFETSSCLCSAVRLADAMRVSACCGVVVLWCVAEFSLLSRGFIYWRNEDRRVSFDGFGDGRVGRGGVRVLEAMRLLVG